ncbi:MAG TPA: universal stress protein [Verrucomicrobia bacterium]|nr:universal stress protein [Verrucomicrobiota bacterium]HOP98905.1 universal stress protein [Verrucomicrobiota bacterium]HPU55077.1 universal stress protein [Verrucomicrobiota bacterium]
MRMNLGSRTPDHGSDDIRDIAVTQTGVQPVARPECRPNGKTRRQRNSPHGSMPTILVAVDFRPASLKAVEQAFTWAKELGASVLLLHVLDRVSAGGFVDLVTRHKPRRDARSHAMQRIKELAESYRSYGVPFMCVVQDGLPEVEIIEVAAKMNVKMIVLGRQPRYLLGRWILGSVSEDIADLAPCPVMLVNRRMAVSAR